MGDVDEEDDDMNIHECGTRWRSLSAIAADEDDDMFSIDESVWRLDDGVGNGRNEDADGKRSIFSLDMVNWSVELVIADRD